MAGSSGTVGWGAVRLSRIALVAGEFCVAGERGSDGAPLVAAPANTGCQVGGTRLLCASMTSATMQVMLSGPPPLMASSTRRSAALSGSGIEPSAWCRVCSVTTPDRPSEQSR